MRKCIVIIMCTCIFLIPAFAGATVLTFDDISGDPFNPIANGYGGLNWSNMYAFDPVASGFSGTGYQLGIVSGTNVAFNGIGDQAAVSDGTFDFNGAYFSSAYNDGILLTVTGYLGAVQMYQSQVTLNVVAAQYYSFNFLGIDSLTFSTSPSLQFAMDNFTYNNAPVPEPSTMMLLGSGLAGLVGYGRRRFKK